MSASLNQDQLLEAYRRMLRIRQFELRATSLLRKGLIRGGLHTSVGQEASIVGACMALDPTDYIVGTHRSHGHPIGKGAQVDRLLAELLGREAGINHGKGGSMHLSDFSVGSLGETSIVGSGLPVAAGAALGSQLKGDGRVTLCFFGDGASNEGTFHESLNLASIWDLPVVYLCENNGYGELTAASAVMRVKHVSDRAVAYDIPGQSVDGQDVLAVYEMTREAVRRARAGEGPSLIETLTYRFDNHAYGLQLEHYRPASEVDHWRAERDPIPLFRTALLDRHQLSENQLDAVVAEVDAELAAAVEFAQNSAAPPPELAFTDVFTDSIISGS
jgi:pyruvate dehydrogenase E1 component alpha subunit